LMLLTAFFLANHLLQRDHKFNIQVIC
jgi:hypothetical protein